MNYPGLFVYNSAEPDKVCPGETLTNMATLLGRQIEIGWNEQRHARNNLLIPLNSKLSQITNQNGWSLIDVEKSFYGNAICNTEHYVNRYNQSIEIQGDKKGVIHPSS